MKKTLSILMTLLLIISTLSPMSSAVEKSVYIDSTGDADMDMPSSLADGEIWAGKSVEYDGNGEFIITLKATGQNFSLETETLQENLDVVLVLDTSGSMDEGGKLASMKAAADAAIDTILSVGDNRIALVRYSNMATLDFSFHNNATALKARYNNWNASGGTNIQNAFLVSETLLKNRTDKTRKPIIILLSDGEPTYYHNDFDTQTGQFNGRNEKTGGNVQGDGKNATNTGIWNTILQANRAKSVIPDLRIYTIGVGVGSNASAIATLQPTDSRTVNMRPMVSQLQKRDIVETANYKFERTQTRSWVSTGWFSGYWGPWSEWSNWSQQSGRTSAKEVKGNWTDYSGPQVNKEWSSATITGDFFNSSTSISSGWNQETNTQTAYKVGTRTKSEYQTIQVRTPFAHKYYEDESTLSASDPQSILDAFMKITNTLISHKPNTTTIEGDVFSDVVITDILGEGFELVGTASGFDYNSTTGTVVWTIPGSTFNTMNAGSTTVDSNKIHTLSFRVKLSDLTVIGTHYTNKSANIAFSVIEENDHYDEIGQVTQDIPNTGWIKILETPKGMVNVHHEYADESPFDEPETLEGYVNTIYTALKKNAPLYDITLKAGSAPETGVFGEAVQEVTFVYTLKEVPTGYVNVHHEYPDETPFDGSDELHGPYGTDYTALAKHAPLYDITLKAGSDPVKGVFGEAVQEVTFVYTLKEVPVEPETYSLIVNHLLSTGGNYAGQEVTPGFIAEAPYVTSPASYNAELYTVSIPSNSKGNFGSSNVTVNYIYTPIIPVIPPVEPPVEPPTPIPTEPTPVGPQGTVLVSFVDTNGVSISPSYQFAGSIGTNYGTSARSIDGYTLVETPANATGTFTEASQSVVYVYSDGSVVEVEDEDVALGATRMTDIDQFLVAMPAIEPETIEVEDEEVALADGLPETGQLPSEIFFGIGGLISAAGALLKKKK